MRILSSLLLALFSFAAFAQSAAAEAPAEKANFLTILLFLGVFAACCVGYFVYARMDAKKAKEHAE